MARKRFFYALEDGQRQILLDSISPSLRAKVSQMLDKAEEKLPYLYGATLSVAPAPTVKRLINDLKKRKSLIGAG